MNKYILMQKTQCESLAEEWLLENGVPVVGCFDVVDSPDEIKHVLEKIRFSSFNYNIGETSPCAAHKNRIYFNVEQV